MKTKNEKTWDIFWDEFCVSMWGKTKNPYKPPLQIRKVMNRFLIKKNKSK